MRVLHATLGAIALIFVANQASGTLMLGSLLMALKGGLFATKMGVGGLLAMALAGTQNQQTGLGGNLASLTTTTYGAPHKRSTRSVQTAAEMPLPVNVTDPESESKVLEKLASNLNDVSSPVTKRMMRQIAILDQLSCLPKFICGMNTRTPSKKTSAINDYGFLIKYLFQRDDEDAEQDDEEDDEDGDDDLSRTDNVDLTSKTKNQAKKHPLSEDEEDSSDEDVQQDPEALNEQEDEQLDHEAQEELLRTEPEMMLYAMTEDKYRKQRIPGINKNYGVDHAGLSGYNKEDYWYRKNPLLNTDSATQILREKSRLPPSPYRNKEWDDVDFKEERPGLFSTILPAFISFKRKKISLTKGNSGENDPFANDPFFDGFRRKKSLPTKSNEAEDIRTEFVMQRRNSRFANPLSFFQRKRQELQNATDPLKKYEIAEDFGRQTKNSRQCRMLFARCPYTYNEISGMIGNVKKLVSAQATVGDKETSQKKNAQNAQIESGAQTSKYSSVGYTKGGIPGGTTQISHELDNGDKVEILFKIRPKGGNNGAQSLYLPPSEDPELIKANKTIQDMRKALQAIATLHNQTDLEALKEKTEQSIAEILKETLQEKAQTAQPALDISTTTAASATTSAPVIRIPVTKIRPETSSKAEQEDDPESDEEDDDGDDDDEEDEDDEDANDSLPGPVGPPPPADESHFHYYRKNAEGMKGKNGLKKSPSKSHESTANGEASNQSSPSFDIVTPESSQQNDEEESVSAVTSNPELLPKPTKNRPATRIKKPAVLPPLPSPYKIVRKKTGNKSQEDSDDTARA